jgi:hypothetical protein
LYRRLTPVAAREIQRGEKFVAAGGDIAKGFFVPVPGYGKPLSGTAIVTSHDRVIKPLGESPGEIAGCGHGEFLGCHLFPRIEAALEKPVFIEAFPEAGRDER